MHGIAPLSPLNNMLDTVPKNFSQVEISEG